MSNEKVLVIFIVRFRGRLKVSDGLCEYFLCFINREKSCHRAFSSAFLCQIFRQPALAQHAAGALAAAAGHAHIAGVGVGAHIIERAQIIGQRLSLRFGKIHQRRVDLKSIIHRQIEGDIHRFHKHIAAVGVA